MDFPLDESVDLRHILRRRSIQREANRGAAQSHSTCKTHAPATF